MAPRSGRFGRPKVRAENPTGACGFIDHMTIDELKECAVGDEFDATCPSCGMFHLNREEIDRILRIAVRGRNLDGNTKPILVDGAPQCHACDKPYTADRLKAGVPMSHICCGCAEVFEAHQPLQYFKRGFHGHPGRTFSRRDDCPGN